VDLGIDISSGDLVAQSIAQSDVQDFALTGLDGDRDGEYLVDGIIHMIQNATPSMLTWRPNGVITNMYQRISVEEAPSGTSSEWKVTDSATFAIPAFLRLRAEFGASRVIGGVATPRWHKTSASAHYGASATAWRYETGGTWKEVVTNLTSMHLFASAGAYIGQGSVLRAWRTPRRFPTTLAG